MQIFNDPSDSVGHAWTGDPRNVPLKNNQLLTIAFVPKGVSIPAPPAQAIYNLEHLNDVQPTSTSTTTPVPATSSTVPATSTTAPSTSTTAKR